MSHVFKNQTLLTIVLETNYASLASATVKKILYKDPNGRVGSWNATSSGTTLTYNISTDDVIRAGRWEFQSYIEVGGLKGFGKIATHNFEQPLQ